MGYEPASAGGSYAIGEPAGQSRRPPANHIGIVMHDFSTGGSERIAIRLANRWATAGRRVTLFVGNPAGPARALISASVEIVGACPAVPRGLLSRMLLGRRLAMTIDAVGPDLLFVPGNFHIPVVAALSARLGDRCPPVICKLSNPLRRSDRSPLSQWLHEAILRRQTRRIDCLVAMAPSLAQEAQLILGEARIATIAEPNIDEDRPVIQRDTRPARHRILCAGRLVQQKNFALALRATAQVDRALDIELAIHGEGPLRGALETLARQLGIEDRVLFGGHVPDLLPALHAASLFLISSRYEGYPAVAVEALVAGVPVITTACSPAMPDILRSEKDGAIVEADPAAIARAIELRLRRGVAVSSSRWLADHHRADRVAADYLALFDEQAGLGRA